MKKISVRELFKTFLLFFVIGVLAFSVNLTFAASPFTWSLTTPANTDPVNIFPALYRSDIKTVIGASPSASGGILGTLQPYGTANTGFRENQINDDSWLCQNAYFTSTTVANRDNTSINTVCIDLENSVPDIKLSYAAFASNPITFTTLVQFSPVASAVNYLTLNSASTGNNVTLNSSGTDTNIGLTLGTKGTGSIFLYPGFNIGFYIVGVASSVDGIQTTPSATGNPATVSFSAIGNDANINFNLLSKGTGSLQLNNPSFQVPIIASVVDGIQANGSATGNPATVNFTATGSDTNINLNLISKGTGVVQCNGATCGGVLGNVQSFTSGSGTYTTPSGTKVLWIRACGGGGGGGGSNNANVGGGGGGAGGCGEYWVSSPSASYSYAVGSGGAGCTVSCSGTTGGTTTFGTSLVSCTGGTGGAGNGSTNSLSVAGGTCTGVTLNYSGGYGGGGLVSTGTAGSGGSSLFGGGAGMTTAATGTNSGVPGTGASGGAGTTGSGGTGANGIIIAVAY